MKMILLCKQTISCVNRITDACREPGYGNDGLIAEWKKKNQHISRNWHQGCNYNEQIWM